MSSDEFPSVPQMPPASAPPATSDSLADRMASPLDRLAAVIADLIILSPLATLAMSPFRRLASEALLQGRDDAWLIATASGVGISILLALAYQTFFLVKWRATPGKRLFGLTVESLWDQEGAPIRTQAAFMRSCALCIEILLLGLPLLGVFGNERRRPLHDRLADTIVLSKKRTRVGLPGLSEKSLASGLVSAFFTSLLIIAIFKFGRIHLSSPSQTADNDPTSILCEAVGRAETSWVPALGETKPSRISIALALYEAEAIDESCLRTEADGALWLRGDKDLGYLARGLAEKNDDDVAQDYFNKACDGVKETDACRALSLLNSSEGRRERPEDPVEAKAQEVVQDSDVLAVTTSLKSNSETFLKILAVRELVARRQEARALTLLETIAPQRGLAYFLAGERSKALWAIGDRQKAREILKTSVASLDGDQRVALTRWFCYAETSVAGCSDTAKLPCDLLAASIENDKVLLGDPEVAVTYIRGESCGDRLNEQKLADLKSETPDTNSQQYFEALSQIATAHEEKGVEFLKAIAAKEEAPFFIEAELKLAQLAKSEKELTSIREQWSDADPDAEGWASLGKTLMERYNEFKAWDKSIDIGFKISETESLDLSVVRPMVVAAYRSGQTKMAMGYWQTYFKNDLNAVTRDDSNERLPASSGDGFDQVVREMKSDLVAPVFPKKLPLKRAKRGVRK